MNKKKILGIIGLTLSAVVTSIVTTWMTDREIENKVNEAFAKREIEEENESNEEEN